MAKIGEGDARWLVTDMGEGGRNVNNWHWSEKDCTDWSKQRLDALFKNVPLVDTPLIRAQATGLESLEGEAFLTVRKNKLIPSYELTIKLGWQGAIKDGDGNDAGTAQGTLHLPYVADENHDEDPELRVICQSSDAASQRIKDAINSTGKKVRHGVISSSSSCGWAPLELD